MPRLVKVVVLEIHDSTSYRMTTLEILVVIEYRESQKRNTGKCCETVFSQYAVLALMPNVLMPPF